MSYISQEDYKKMMENFKTGAPKGMLKEALDPVGKEDSDIDNDGDTDKTDKYLANRRKAVGKAIGKGRMMREDDEEQEEPMHDYGDVKQLAAKVSAAVGERVRFDDYDMNDRPIFIGKKQDIEYTVDPAGTVWKHNGFTHQEVGTVNERQVNESLPENDKWYEDFENGLRNLANNKYISQFELQQYMKALDHVDPMDNYSEFDGHDAAKEFVDDLRTKNQMDADDEQWKSEHGGYDFGGDDFNDGEFWENEIKKLQEIAGVGPQDDGPEDDDEEEREARAKKAEMDDEEAENAERDLDEEDEKLNLRAPESAAKNVAKKYGAELKPKFDEYQKSHEEYIQAIRKYDSTDPEFREITKAHNALVKAFQGNALGLARQEMEDAGEKPVVARNLAYGYSDEDWPSEFVTALNKELKGVAEGLHMPPLQATGQTIMTNEDQAPYGFEVLSPDERNQLKEYIKSIKTIKEEIAKLVGKAGKKVKEGDLGGDRTDLVMTKAEMWEEEGHEEGKHERIEGLLDQKLHDAFYKVTGMIMKDLMDDGFNEGDIKLFLQHEIEEKAKEYSMSQYDPH